VVEGTGTIEIKSETKRNTFSRYEHLEAGDWIEIPPGEFHALHNYINHHYAYETKEIPNDESLVVVCVNQPKFDMSDVFWSD